MKRVLCILSNMNAGGAETFLMKIYRQLDRSKYQLDFCVNTQEKNYYEDEIIDLGGRIYRITPKSKSVNSFKNELSQVVTDNGYKYVLRITSNAAGFMDLKIAKKAGADICCARSSNASDGGGIQPFIAHRLGRFLYGKYVDVKIAPSDLAAKYTFGRSAFNKGKVNILHNAVDLNIFHFDPKGRNEIRREFNISDEIKVIGHVGRFNEQKNHRFLIDIFSCINKEDPSTILMLIGNGTLEAEIKSKVSEMGLESNVIFTGVRSDITKLLSAIDVFVFPSFYEGMPNTVIEAQACGLPCVISDSITKEANITDLVEYVSLSESAEFWKNVVMKKMNIDRIDTGSIFKRKRYNIESTVSDFIKYVFGEE